MLIENAHTTGSWRRMVQERLELPLALMWAHSSRRAERVGCHSQKRFHYGKKGWDVGLDERKKGAV